MVCLRCNMACMVLEQTDSLINYGLGALPSSFHRWTSLPRVTNCFQYNTQRRKKPHIHPLCAILHQYCTQQKPKLNDKVTSGVDIQCHFFLLHAMIHAIWHHVSGYLPHVYKRCNLECKREQNGTGNPLTEMRRE